MTAMVIVRGEDHPVKEGQTLEEALRALGLHPEMFLAVRDGELVAMDALLREGDRVRLVAVASGG